MDVLRPGPSVGHSRNIIGPVGGWFLAVPANGAPSPLIVDLSKYKGGFVRISALEGDVLYVFGDEDDTDMASLLPPAGPFVFDETALVPDVIWECSSVREVIPVEKPYLILRTRGDAGLALMRRS